MSTENIDDLFRRQLGDHETPPGDELWARLQAAPAAAAQPGTPPAPEASAPGPDRLDQLFLQKLSPYATPPPREIWERLEDEHLRPRKRRAAAWWPLAMAAALALLLLAGGAGLWLGFPGGAGQRSTVALEPVNKQSDKAGANADGQLRTGGPNSGNAGTTKPGQLTLAAAAVTKAADGRAGTAAAGHTLAQTSETRIFGLSKKKLPARATRPDGPASSASKVGMMAQQSPRRPRGASRQPDAAAASAPLVARTTPPLNIPPTQPADEPAPAVASAHLPVPTPTPAGEIVPAATANPATLAAATLITVDVRNGAARRPSLATAVASAAAATEERQGLGGRLLRQVGHAVRGERLSLSEVTGLPENLTLEATIAGRRVSKSIQL